MILESISYFSTLFNSRPHGGRPAAGILGRLTAYFNSRPHGGRRDFSQEYRHWDVISTHALTEGDIIQSGAGYSADYFNSRPHGGRHRDVFVCGGICHISTPALTEGDNGFNLVCQPFLQFQLTPSRRATKPESEWIVRENISTHALTEGDLAPIVSYIL